MRATRKDVRSYVHPMSRAALPRDFALLAGFAALGVSALLAGARAHAPGMPTLWLCFLAALAYAAFLLPWDRKQ